MSSVFGTAKKPKWKAFGYESDPRTRPTQDITEDATRAGRRKKKHLMAAGTKTRIAGYQSALLSGLNRRLGE